MNEPAVLCLLRSTIFMDLLGESPIGALATLIASDSKLQRPPASRDRNHGRRKGSVGHGEGGFSEA